MKGYSDHVAAASRDRLLANSYFWTRLLCPWILQARILERVAMPFSNVCYIHSKMLNSLYHSLCSILIALLLLYPMFSKERSPAVMQSRLIDLALSWVLRAAP